MDALLHALQSAVGRKDTDNKVGSRVAQQAPGGLSLSTSHKGWGSGVGALSYLGGTEGNGCVGLGQRPGSGHLAVATL